MPYKNPGATGMSKINLSLSGNTPKTDFTSGAKKSRAAIDKAIAAPISESTTSMAGGDGTSHETIHEPTVNTNVPSFKQNDPLSTTNIDASAPPHDATHSVLAPTDTRQNKLIGNVVANISNSTMKSGVGDSYSPQQVVDKGNIEHKARGGKNDVFGTGPKRDATVLQMSANQKIDKVVSKSDASSKSAWDHVRSVSTPSSSAEKGNTSYQSQQTSGSDKITKKENKAWAKERTKEVKTNKKDSFKTSKQQYKKDIKSKKESWRNQSTRSYGSSTLGHYSAGSYAKSRIAKPKKSDY